MDRDDVKNFLHCARMSTPKRRREVIHGVVEYRCDCGALMKVGLAEGIFVSARAGTFDLSASEEITCLFPDCEETATLDDDSYDHFVEPVVAILRVPSRRAMIEMIERGVAEAQLMVIG